MAVLDIGRLLRIAGELRLDEVDSPALRGNPLGDPSLRPLAVYLPPGYDPEGSRRYPVLYALHGYAGDLASMLSARPWELNVVQWVDRLIVEGAMPPVLLVLIDGFTALGGSQYVDSPHNGAYATYAARDVVDYVDRSYRTLAHEGARAVFGKSSGGFGALHLAMHWPGVFGALASHSGDCYFPYAYAPGFPTARRMLARYDFDCSAFVRDLAGKKKRSGAEFQTLEMLAYAAAYSPTRAEAFAFELPFDHETGELRDAVFARWRAFDPVEACAAHQAELARLRLRYLDCGNRDEHALDVGARVLARRLREMGLDVRHEEFDDGHRGTSYRHAVSLPLLAQALDRAE